MRKYATAIRHRIREQLSHAAGRTLRRFRAATYRDWPVQSRFLKAMFADVSWCPWLEWRLLQELLELSAETGNEGLVCLAALGAALPSQQEPVPAHIGSRTNG